MVQSLHEERRTAGGAAVAPPRPKGSRLVSLDAFRGLTIAGMLIVNNPGSWGAIHPPLAHAAPSSAGVQAAVETGGLQTWHASDGLAAPAAWLPGAVQMGY